MQEELLRFGPFELDPETEELKRSSLVLRLPRQPFRVLLLLVRRAGEIVSRDEIHAAIWGDEIHVDFEHGINAAIRQIRFVLGDHADAPRYIRTLPRRGYSFIAAVERVARPGESAPEPEALAPAPARRRFITPRIAAIAAAMAIAIAGLVAWISQSRRSAKPAGRTVAVRPFHRLGPAIAGIDERSFAEELRATIGRLPRERVIVIEPDANADVVIDGTIREVADGVRVIVSVVDAKTQTRIWSDAFLRPARRKEGMAVEVAHQVMHEIARRYLPPARREPLLRTKASPAALALYKRARLAHLRSQAYDWMRTRELYEAAIQAEPRFAEAWSGLSDVWVGQTLGAAPGECDLAAPRAKECARRAIVLQPLNAEAWATLGQVAGQHDFDLAAAEDSMRRAVSVDPGYVQGRSGLAMVLAMRGQTEEALSELAAAQQLDPITLDLTPIEAMLYFHARRFEDARARFREMLAINPDTLIGNWGLMHTYIVQKNWGEAIAAARNLPQFPRVPEGIPPTEAGFLKMYRGYESFMRESRRQDRFNDYFLAMYYGQLGNQGEAFKLLNDAVDNHVPNLSYIMVDPRLDTLRNDARFDIVVARMNLGRPPKLATLDPLSPGARTARAPRR